MWRFAMRGLIWVGFGSLAAGCGLVREERVAGPVRFDAVAVDEFALADAVASSDAADGADVADIPESLDLDVAEVDAPDVPDLDVVVQELPICIPLCDGATCADGCGGTCPGHPCSDGSACTLSDVCQDGVCQGVVAVCDDQNPCTTDTCDPLAGCVQLPTTTDCDDGNACTTADACVAGACKGTAINVPETCGDGNECTADTCVPEVGCVNAALTATPCADGNCCTYQDLCVAGQCVAGADHCGCETAADCALPPGVGPCTARLCKHSVYSPDKCMKTCTADPATEPKSCNDANPCTVDTCSLTGECSHTVVADGTFCSDWDGCTTGDACEAGVCKSGPPKVCGCGAACQAGACPTPAGMVFIPPGQFLMGCVPGDTACTPQEKPQHLVTLDGYYIDATEVTVARYQACMDAGACKIPKYAGSKFNWGKSGREQHPINGVDWPQSAAFCTWAGGRLPTEAEWERAGRGGLEGKEFPWGDEPPTCTPGLKNTAVYKSGDVYAAGCGKGGTWAVATGSSANGFGLYDMAGNVWEWVADGYGFHSSVPTFNPLVPDNDGAGHVMRGGGNGSPGGSESNDLRVSFRVGPSGPNEGLGFRCAKSCP